MGALLSSEATVKLSDFLPYSMVCLTFSTHYRILRTGDQTRDEAFAELGSELSLEDQVRLADSVDSE